MSIPWWAYILGILLVLPFYALWAVAGFGLLRALYSWLTMPQPEESQPRIRGRR